MKTKILTGTITGIIAASVAIGVMSFSADRHRRGSHQHDSSKVVRLLDRKLDLDDHQEQRLKVLLDELNAEGKSFELSGERIETGIMKAFDNDSFDKEGLNEMFNKELQGYKKSQEVLLSKIEEIHQLLKKEQRAALLNLMSKRKTKHHHRHAH